MSLHNREIADCGSFCEVIFFCIFPKNLIGEFFDSLAIDVKGSGLLLTHVALTKDSRTPNSSSTIRIDHFDPVFGPAAGGIHPLLKIYFPWDGISPSHFIPYFSKRARTLSLFILRKLVIGCCSPARIPSAKYRVTEDRAMPSILAASPVEINPSPIFNAPFGLISPPDAYDR